jgi:hypothetical protein
MAWNGGGSALGGLSITNPLHIAVASVAHVGVPPFDSDIFAFVALS